jgi:soluble lytic murein transglycosylase-like protein
MRPILATAILLLSLSSVAHEPDHASQLAVSIGRGKSSQSVVASEPSRGDRERILQHPASRLGKPPPADSARAAAVAAQPSAEAQIHAAPAVNDLPPPQQSPSLNREAAPTPSIPLDRLCSALFSYAQDNGLPVAFFANLIWRESRLRNDAVSAKGALGIAQFMPEVAEASGLENPFDPLQALSASAWLLGELRDQFGNLGFVAAAYNAGVKRVIEWLKRRRTLPRETRFYVLDVTGHTIEQWKERPPDSAALRLARKLPCRNFPGFAKLQQMQSQPAQPNGTAAAAGKAASARDKTLAPCTRGVQCQARAPGRTQESAHATPIRRDPHRRASPLSPQPRRRPSLS